MSYFRSPFIQRLIEHHWTKLRPRLVIQMLVYFSIYGMIFMIAALSDFRDSEDEEDGRVKYWGFKFWLYCFDALLLVYNILSVEIRQCRSMGFKYF
jgi:hypothetical protein